MVDMPYMSFHLSAQQAVDNAAKYVSQAGAEVMKCEGNQHHAKYIEAIVKAGIPVQGHIGICPMRIPQLGGFAAQGKTADRAKELVDDAWAFVDAGCFSIMTEVVTSEVSQYLAETLPVPVISLGSGNTSDGVHIIGSDLFHLYEKHTPRHSQDLLRPCPDHRKRPDRLPRRSQKAHLSGQGTYRLHEGRRAQKVQGQGGLEKVIAAGRASVRRRRRIVARHRVLRGTAAPQRERVAALGRIETLSAGRPDLRHRRCSGRLYVLVDGMVRFSIGLGSRRTAAGQVLRRGEVFGWAALVEQAPQRIASAFCITLLHVLAINGDQLLLLMEADHSLGLPAMKQLNVLITSNLTSFASG